jgi:hypothetical protein
MRPQGITGKSAETRWADDSTLAPRGRMTWRNADEAWAQKANVACCGHPRRARNSLSATNGSPLLVRAGFRRRLRLRRLRRIGRRLLRLGHRLIVLRRRHMVIAGKRGGDECRRECAAEDKFRQIRTHVVPPFRPASSPQSSTAACGRKMRHARDGLQPGRRLLYVAGFGSRHNYEERKGLKGGDRRSGAMNRRDRPQSGPVGQEFGVLGSRFIDHGVRYVPAGAFFKVPARLTATWRRHCRRRR